MGDMAEDFKALKEHLKQRRTERAEVNIQRLKDAQITAIEQSKNVFRINGKDGAVMYYPPSNKWQHKGRTCSGSFDDFRNWLKKKGYLDGQ